MDHIPDQHDVSTHHNNLSRVSLSIIIPAFNEEAHIGATLEALQKLDYPKGLLEIIVVDNGSTDRTKEIADQYLERTYCLKEGNVGAVRNYGANIASGKILAFLDADCIVDKAWAQRGVNLVYKNPNTCFGGSYLCQDDSNWVERYWLLENPEQSKSQKDLLGGTIFITKLAFEAAGGFNEEMTSGEDSELSMRLRKNGINVQITSDLNVIHLGNPRTLGHFCRRQIWHSENYIQFLTESIKDPAFLLINTFIVTLLSSVILISIRGPDRYACFAFMVTFFIPTIFSAKRIMDSHYRLKKSPDEVLKIYILDLLYVSSRAIGIFKSLISTLKSEQK